MVMEKDKKKSKVLSPKMLAKIRGGGEGKVDRDKFRPPTNGKD